jgi:hypothetical protein
METKVARMMASPRRLQTLGFSPDNFPTPYVSPMRGNIMAGTEIRNVRGAMITVRGGSNVRAAAVKHTADVAAMIVDSLSIPAGTEINVECGTQASRCGSRRNGVHYKRGSVHVVGVHGRFFRATDISDEGASTLAHELIHCDQYANERIVSRYDYSKGFWFYTFSGEWTGTKGHRKYVEEVFRRPRNPTYETYRNFGWEQEAFEMQEQISKDALRAVFEGKKPRAAKPSKISKPSSGKFVCKHCGKEYGSRQGRYNHIRKNHA